MPRSCAGSQTPRSPHRACTQLVSPSTPSRRRVRRHERSTGAAGAGGVAGASARLPYPSPTEQKQDARVLNKKRKSQKRNTHPPKNQGENAGKTRQGEPHPPRRKEEETPLGQKNPERNRQNNGGRTLMKVPSGWKPMMHASSSSSRRKVVNKKSQTNTKTSPANPVVRRSS